MYTAGMENRFWKRVDKSGDCWLWIGYTTQAGYGQLKWGAKLDYAHRVSYLLSGKEIPAKMTIDHLCRARACVNPAHMEVVTRGENVLRGNSPSALNKVKNNCKRGHPLTVNDVYVYRNTRSCRKCRNQRQKGYRA